MTDSGYKDPRGLVIRSADVARGEGEKAAALLGYQLICLDQDALEIPANDRNTCEILNVLSSKNIDTVFTHWHHDTHPPHKRVNEMATHACRHIPRLLGFAVNWYVGVEQFAPQFFVPLSDRDWQQKIAALRCYESEFSRTEGRWHTYLDNQSQNYGTQLGVDRAEGFIVYKYQWDI